jgi:hypothetical protein
MPEFFKPPTHTAYAFRRMGKKPHQGRWLEVGTGRLDADGKFHTFMDRTPTGGFNGYVFLSPIGSGPPATEQKPQRPDGDDDSADDHADG